VRKLLANRVLMGGEALGPYLSHPSEASGEG
jgi:hypothetical protein